jgi:undecaprenyl-diphosphatase
MNFLDQWVINIINYVGTSSPNFNLLVSVVSHNTFIKLAVVLACMWWLWFDTGPKQKQTRIILITTMVANFISLGVARVLVNKLPFRIRPMFDENISLVETYVDPGFNFFDKLSSFPSDHAVLLVGLSFGTYLASKKLGMFLLIYSLLIALLPRVYLGIHFMTDIIAGGILGATTVFLISKMSIVEKFSTKIYDFSENNPQMFYALMFLLTYETASLYKHIRGILGYFLQLLSN